MKKQNYFSEKKVKLSTFIYAFLIILVVIIGMCSVLAYGTQTEIGKKIASFVSKNVPFPVAIVGYTHMIYMHDVKKNLASVKYFYQTQDLSQTGLRVDFSTPDGQKRLKIKEREILDKLIEDKIIEVLAKKNGISFSETDVDKIVSQKETKYGKTDDLQVELFDLYQWNMDDFKQRVILPDLYREALAFYANGKESDNTKSQEKIKQAQKEIFDGKDFAEVVNKYSDGSSKENGGELGWVVKSQVLPELQEALFDSKILERGTIIESSIGFHIVEIENKKKDQDKDKDVLQLRQIFVAKNTFVNWLIAQKKQMKVSIFLSDFFWNNSNAEVDFRALEMRIFEKDQQSKAEGDASIIF
jgi:hypothetical protein